MALMDREQESGKFLFVGNRLWLDLVNTEVIKQDERVDLLLEFDDLTDWSIAAGVFSKEQTMKAGAFWFGPEREGALTLAREFRTSLRETAERLVTGRSVKDSTIDLINRRLRRRDGYMELKRVKGNYEKYFHPELTEASQLLTPVADSVATSLCDDDLSLLRKCENPACILFFYDVSKNHVRRWCSMSGCGNRMKAAAHYERQKRIKG
jgi:predicted RNA-binding Zn ribbon-like protein